VGSFEANRALVGETPLKEYIAGVLGLLHWVEVESAGGQDARRPEGRMGNTALSDDRERETVKEVRDDREC
jgi:hypothetical protein